MMLLELEAFKKQEKIDEQLAANNYQADIRKKHEEMTNSQKKSKLQNSKRRKQEPYKSQKTK